MFKKYSSKADKWEEKNKSDKLRVRGSKYIESNECENSTDKHTNEASIESDKYVFVIIENFKKECGAKYDK